MEQEDGFYRVRLMKLALDPFDEFVTLAVNRILGVEQLPPFSVALALQRPQRLLSLQFVFKQSGERRRFPRLTKIHL
jgi:hypothetical protein